MDVSITAGNFPLDKNLSLPESNWPLKTFQYVRQCKDSLIVLNCLAAIYEY